MNILILSLVELIEPIEAHSKPLRVTPMSQPNCSALATGYESPTNEYVVGLVRPTKRSVGNAKL